MPQLMFTQIVDTLGRASPGLGVVWLLLAGALRAQDAQPPSDSGTRVQTITVTGEQQGPVTPMQRLTLPVHATITAPQFQHTINVVDPEDAVKYLPSV